MKAVVIVQARMGSTRLPGKVLREANGEPLIAHLFNRLKLSKRAHSLMLATTDQPQDDPLEAWAKIYQIDVFRGSSSDVLDRYFQAVRNGVEDTVVRITGDCPLLDPNVVDHVLERFASGKFDYVSNVQVRTYPRGLDVEVFSRTVLETAHAEAKNDFEREHVTPFIYQNSERFSIGGVENERDLSFHRWTVDTEEDFELVRRILDRLPPGHFSMGDVLEVLDDHPDWLEINSQIVQKKLEGA